MSPPASPELAPASTAAPPAAGPGPMPPTPVFPAAPPAARRMPVLWIAIAVVVVVLIVIIALVLSGVVSFSAKGGSAGAETFSGSRGAAQAAANGASGGPWNLLLVAGIATQEPLASSVSNLTGVASGIAGSACDFTAGSGVPQSVTSPGVANVSQGNAGSWVYMYTNASGDVLLVSVVSGSAKVVGTLSGSSCDLASAGFAAIPSSGIIDSTAASSAANAAGGYAFLAAHPRANATFALLGGFSAFGTTLGPTWVVLYLACSLSGPGPSTAPEFEAAISATSGGVLTHQITTATCPSTSGGNPLGGALTLGTPRESQVGSNQWYNFSVNSAAGGLTWSDLTLSIESGSQTVSDPGAVATVLDLVGSTVASYDLASGAWTGSASSPVNSQDVLSIESPISLSGDSLLVQGSNSFSGSITVPIS